MDIEYLLLLQRLRELTNDILTPFMETISLFSVSYLVFIPILIYWIYDRRKGLLPLASFYLCIGINAVVKLTACIYRPWIRDARVVTAGDAISTATGYSFPSGHTATASPLLAGMARVFSDTNKWFSRICIIVLLTIAFSRNYLGVHTPQDVLIALLEGFITVFVMDKIFAYVETNPEKEDILLLLEFLFALMGLVYITFKTYPMNYVDGVLIVDPQKMMNDGYGDTAFLIAFCIGRYIEKKWVQFHPTGINPKGIIVAAIGMIIFVYMNDHIGAPLDHMLGSHWGHFARRMITVLFYTVAYPFVIKLVCGNDAAAETAEEEE